MDVKPKLDPRDTLVLDEDEIAELDELSLTGIMRDASGFQEQLDKDANPKTELDDLEFGVLDSDD